MNDTAIRVENLGKLYQIGQGYHHTLRETLTRAMSAPLRAFTSSLNGRNARNSEPEAASQEHGSDSIWALRNVSFEIKKGETVGIIGPNGSGKSTLLKLLARITESTEGEIYINGRITALIELGAGFHPELTGRENIYLSGAVLGLKRSEVDARFSAVVDFGELWDFVDTPVKHYSSGMYLRLGFSVAVQSNPQILLADELLTVGDMFFRQRCLSTMEHYRNEGKTILLVTHDPNLVKSFCNRAILFADGRILADGNPEFVGESYIMWTRQKQLGSVAGGRKVAIKAVESPNVTHRFGTGDGEVTSVVVMNKDLEETSLFSCGDTMVIRVEFSVKDGVNKPNLGVQIRDANGYIVYGTNSAMQNMDIVYVNNSPRCARVCFRLPLRLAEGFYTLTVALDDLSGEQTNIPLDKQTGVKMFKILEGERKFMGVVDLQAEAYQD
jgi:homopolymeric O-antigen transport system ATP-binding protein